ncbi:WSCD family member AAEL009094 [Anoplophora glabripennis]|uniref:WSCD family member AAEL009094 n=1 Tax=Anoplophora glabripennis TaxID=217634 RepID=UPI0008751474|nr:WSCD family member AAEL009094 [Anoplophora glabripennis]
MLFSRVRFWGLVVLLLVYIAGVLILSAVSLHESKNAGIKTNSESSHQQVSKLKNFEYGLPGFRPPLRRSKINWCSELKYVDPPRETVALASFPGSGNTWLRYLLQQATGFFTGSVYKDYGLLKNGFPAESVLNGSVLVVKTHEWGPKARSKFSKAILLVRSPAPAIQAEFNRQSGGHIGFASPDRYKRTKGKHWQQFVSDKLRGWQQMNLDWLYNFTGPTHVIFYEQLVDNVEHTLRTVIKFLDVPINEELFNCAMERKEGIYRRKKRVLNFDPYTSKMKENLKSIQEKVYEAIYNFAAPASRR